MPGENWIKDAVNEARQVASAVLTVSPEEQVVKQYKSMRGNPQRIMDFTKSKLGPDLTVMELIYESARYADSMERALQNGGNSYGK